VGSLDFVDHTATERATIWKIDMARAKVKIGLANLIEAGGVVAA